jgi:hypothetical protein
MITATTSKRCTRLPPMCPRRPNNHNTTSTTTIVHNMRNSPFIASTKSLTNLIINIPQTHPASGEYFPPPFGGDKSTFH